MPIDSSQTVILDPALANSITNKQIIELLTTGLVSLNNALQIIPQLAVSWQEINNGKIWIFHLRHNLTFSDGTPISSQDIAFSINRALSPALESPCAPILLNQLQDANKFVNNQISTLIGDSILTPDTTTLELILQEPIAYFLTQLAMPCSFVVEKKILSQFNTPFSQQFSTAGSSGPFEINKYLPNQELRLIPNPHYYGLMPQLHALTLPLYPTIEEGYQAYIHGQVDTTNVPLAKLIEDNIRSDMHRTSLFSMHYYTMNYLTKPFDNIQIRQAFALAVNKSMLAQNIWHNAIQPSNQPFPEGVGALINNPESTNNVYNFMGNQTEARTLLEQGMHSEGWTNLAQIPPITLSFTLGSSIMKQEVMAIVHMWKEVLGITVYINELPYQTLQDHIVASIDNPSGLQLWASDWTAEYADPQDWISRQFANGSPLNTMNYGENNTNDTLIEQQTQRAIVQDDNTPNLGSRYEEYLQAEKQLISDVVWIPIGQFQQEWLLSPSIMGFSENSMGYFPPNDWSHIYRIIYS
jgi:peptide/nickel transport system substrate-binding protein/oligopeptide transport system substrate-binding protein